MKYYIQNKNKAKKKWTNIYFRFFFLSWSHWLYYSNFFSNSIFNMYIILISLRNLICYIFTHKIFNLSLFGFACFSLSEFVFICLSVDLSVFLWLNHSFSIAVSISVSAPLSLSTLSLSPLTISLSPNIYPFNPSPPLPLSIISLYLYPPLTHVHTKIQTHRIDRLNQNFNISRASLE